jgi:6-pyruvoyltetrahydropterin/6-carboxytetrahydropterin synthase
MLQTDSVMKVRLVQEFRFEAAHRLPKVPPGHKCAALHGHSYRIEIAVSGKVNEETGWFIDYQRLHDAWAPLFAKLDHHYLNDVQGLENPTSEVLARWLWERFSESLPEQLERVTVFETNDARCEYEGH